jgi:hypothetical protein
MRGGDHRAQRIAQVVTEHGHEHLGEAQSFRALLQPVRKLLRLAIELEKDVGLALENVRVDRLVEKVDGARLVALEKSVLVAHAGGDEDQRHVSCALAAADEFGEFEAVHVGHLHVKEGECDIVDEQQFERVEAGACG